MTTDELEYELWRLPEEPLRENSDEDSSDEDDSRNEEEQRKEEEGEAA